MRAVAMLLAVAANTPAAEVTFYKHVLPVLQQRCQSCHRAGEVAPMSFTTYNDVRPWAKAIREVVITRRMPPWAAEPGVGRKWHNDRSLTAAEIKTLTDWVEAGAPAGKASDAPPAVTFEEGWTMAKPDVIIRPPLEYAIPARGVIEYTYIIVPTNFESDKWVTGLELRPSDRSAVHHLIAWLRKPGSSYMRRYPAGEFFVPRERNDAPAAGERSHDWRELLVGYAPGLQAKDFGPGRAKLIPKGSDIVFELHYTPNGAEKKDRPSLGIKFANEPPAERIATYMVLNPRFTIPPGDPAHRVDAAVTIARDLRVISLMPHMHLRGKSFEYRATYPDGRTETLLRVPKWDFNWQLAYVFEEPLVLPAGTRLECTAHFDNSPNNKWNPDPTKEVRWGDQTWEEMMIGWFDAAIPANAHPGDFIGRPGAAKPRPAD